MNALSVMFSFEVPSVKTVLVGFTIVGVSGMPCLIVTVTPLAMFNAANCRVTVTLVPLPAKVTGALAFTVPVGGVAPFSASVPPALVIDDADEPSFHAPLNVPPLVVVSAVPLRTNVPAAAPLSELVV